jgi:hypothetical protein
MLWAQVFLNFSLSLTVLDQCVDSSHSTYGETQMLCNSLGQSMLKHLNTRQKFSAFNGCENSKSYKTQTLCDPPISNPYLHPDHYNPYKNVLPESTQPNKLFMSKYLCNCSSCLKIHR